MSLSKLEKSSAVILLYWVSFLSHSAFPHLHECPRYIYFFAWWCPMNPKHCFIFFLSFSSALLSELFQKLCLPAQLFFSPTESVVQSFHCVFSLTPVPQVLYSCSFLNNISVCHSLCLTWFDARIWGDSKCESTHQKGHSAGHSSSYGGYRIFRLFDNKELNV